MYKLIIGPITSVLLFNIIFFYYFEQLNTPSFLGYFLSRMCNLISLVCGLLKFKKEDTC